MKKPRNAKPQPLVMEHAPEPPKETDYQRIAKRVMAAVHELNDALKEAHECASMRVYLRRTGSGEPGDPAHFAYHIYQLTHSVLTFSVTVKEPGEPLWRQVKDPGFKHAAGRFGLDTLAQKK